MDGMNVYEVRYTVPYIWNPGVNEKVSRAMIRRNRHMKLLVDTGT